MTNDPCNPKRIGEGDQQVYYQVDCAEGQNISVIVYDLMGRVLFQEISTPEKIIIPVENDQLVVAHFQWGTKSSSLLISK